MASREGDNGREQYPESPAHVREWAPYKRNPADFALTLAEHSGFEAVGRSISPPPSYATPPPSYSRLARLPRLTIPAEDAVQEHATATPADPVATDSFAIESVDNSPTDTSQPRSQDSSLAKIRSRIRKHSTGFRDRLRRPSASSRTSSASTSPSEVTPYLGFEPSTASNSPIHAQELPVIQELDSQPIFPQRSWSNEPSVTYLRSWSDSDHGIQHARHASQASSIVPTPQRGLSIASPRSSHSTSSSVNASDLSGRLQSLHRERQQQNPEMVVSPCSPVSANNGYNFGRQASLSRSNAITDSIHRNQHPVSPLSPAPSGPPVTPTLDGRLERLPRLAVPPNQTSDRYTNSRHTRNAIEQDDSGKELAISTDSAYGRLDRPFNSPDWAASQGTSSRAPALASPATDAANAPEVVSNEVSIVQPSASATFARQMPNTTRSHYQKPSPSASLVGVLCDAAINAVTTGTDFLRTRYGPEPPVPENHVRVRWRCSCGEDVYDDFIENRAGAAAELEAYLNKIPQQFNFSPSGSQPSSAADSVFSPTGGPSPQSSTSSWPSSGPSSPYQQGWKDLSRQNTQVANHSPYRGNFKSYVNPLWLYTCINEGKWCTKMRHLDVNLSRIGSDKDLAMALSSLYVQVNKRWTKFLKLRGLVSIRFVQFELHRNRIADVSCSPALPNPHSAEGFGYEFEPHDLNPPVGSNYLMHLFKHPEDYDDELITYSRTPKRRDRLEIGTGWGLELVEGFLADRVWGALLALILLGIVIFSITWTCKKGDDMQGAFGVAGYMVAAAGLFLGWAQAAFD